MALADTFNVTGTGDTCWFTSTPPAACTPTGPGSWDCNELRQAVHAINTGTGTGPHVISLPAATIELDVPLGLGLEDNNQCQDLDLTSASDVTIVGVPGASVIDVGGTRFPIADRTHDRAFDVHAGSLTLRDFEIKNARTTIGIVGIDPAAPNHGGGAVRSVVPLTLERMVIINNSVEGTNPLLHPGGGGIYAADTLDVFESDIVENNAPECVGGGLHASGGLTMTDSLVRNNLAASGGIGGGVALDGGINSVIERSTINSNGTSQMGGGIYLFGAGTALSLESSTVDNNRVLWNAPMCGSCVTGGAGIAVDQGTDLSSFNSTISTNSANPILGAGSPNPVGGAIWVTNSAASVDLEYTTIAKNQVTRKMGPADSGLRCDGTCESDDSIHEDPCAPAGALTWNLGNIDAAGGSCSGGPAVAAFLLPLSTSGGSPTETHPHYIGSPADGAANAATCPMVDQRGINRPTPCDSGAHEVP